MINSRMVVAWSDGILTVCKWIAFCEDNNVEKVLEVDSEIWGQSGLHESKVRYVLSLSWTFPIKVPILAIGHLNAHEVKNYLSEKGTNERNQMRWGSLSFGYPMPRPSHDLPASKRPGRLDNIVFNCTILSSARSTSAPARIILRDEGEEKRYWMSYLVIKNRQNLSETYFVMN